MDAPSRTTPALIIDGLRAYLGTAVPTPRGVNRVDHVYWRHLLQNWPAECMSLLPTPWGMRLYGSELAEHFLGFLQRMWRENHDVGADPAYAYFRAQLLTGGGTQPAAARRRSILEGVARSIRASGLHWGARALSAAPRNAVYVNVGQVCWAAPTTTRWLQHRPDVKAVFMLHDVIPLERPEFVTGWSRREMDWMLRTVINRAHGLITTTEAASEAVLAMLRDQGLPPIPVCAAHLPVDDMFRHADPPDPELRDHPYFLACGAIESRKNTGLLLKVWARLVERMGAAAPKLVLAGTVEPSGEAVLRQLEDNAMLRTHVILVSGVGSPRLRQMMVDAQALLMPSFAEGFGLPVIEALTVGTPVIASDIAAHREIGEDHAVYLDPNSEQAWFDTIVRMIETPAWTEALRRKVAGYAPMTEAAYFARIRGFIESL